jgi:hypothetical protein
MDSFGAVSRKHSAGLIGIGPRHASAACASGIINAIKDVGFALKAGS